MRQVFEPHGPEEIAARPRSQAERDQPPCEPVLAHANDAQEGESDAGELDRGVDAVVDEPVERQSQESEQRVSSLEGERQTDRTEGGSDQAGSTPERAGDGFERCHTRASALVPVRLSPAQPARTPEEPVLPASQGAHTRFRYLR